MVVKMLFVCSYNTSRSPAAMRVARKIAGDSKLEVEASSAGLKTSEYRSIPGEMKQALKLKGYDDSDYVPRIINSGMVNRQDYVVALEKSFIPLLEKSFPEAPPGKIVTLSRVSGFGDKDIIDARDRMMKLPPLLSWAYNRLGYLDDNDTEGIIRFNMKTIGQLEMMVSAWFRNLKQKEQ